MTPITSRRTAPNGPARRHRPRRWLALGIVLAALSPVAVGAQTVDSVEAEAVRIENELADTRERLIELAEEYNQASDGAARAQAEVDRANGQLEATRAEYEKRRGAMSTFAVDAYVSGGDMGKVDGLLTTDVSGVGQRQGYLNAANGNHQDLVDQLAAAQEDLDLQLGRVKEAQGEADALQAKVAEARTEAEALAAHQQDVLGEVQGRLAELVAAEQARQAAEEASRAQEAARAAEANRTASAAVSASQTRSPAVVEAAQEMAVASTPATKAPAPASAPVISAPRSNAQVAVDAALSQIGVPYVFGGASPDYGFDCSGLMMWAWGQAGVDIPRPADYQRDAIQPIGLEDLQPGDIVFYGEPVSHDAMYIGNGQIVNAPYTGEYVRVQDMFYSSKPMTYGRVN